MIKDSGLVNIDYDNILLLPTYTTINSRDEVQLKDDNDIYPIFSSPMKNISEPFLIEKLAKLGGIGILHRFFETLVDRKYAVVFLSKNIKPNNSYGVAIGINNIDKELEFVRFALDHGAKYICVDTANGYMEKTIYAVKMLNLLRSLEKYDFKIISGNVITPSGVYLLAAAGSDYIRVGIGSGSLCLTSRVTGIGCPMLTAIHQCSDESSKFFKNVKIIADGGIKSSGEAVKAFAFGADAVMVGGLFGRAKEAENNGVIYGMSSSRLQGEMGKQVKSNEGRVSIVPENEIRPLRDIFEEFVYGIKSGLSYLDCKDLNDLKNKMIEFISV